MFLLLKSLDLYWIILWLKEILAFRVGSSRHSGFPVCSFVLIELLPSYPAKECVVLEPCVDIFLGPCFGIMGLDSFTERESAKATILPLVWCARLLLFCHALSLLLWPLISWRMELYLYLDYLVPFCLFVILFLCTSNHRFILTQHLLIFHLLFPHYDQLQSQSRKQIWLFCKLTYLGCFSNLASVAWTSRMIYSYMTI